MTWSQWIRTVEIEPAVDAGGLVIASQVEALLRTGCKLMHVHVGDEFTRSLSQLPVLVPLVHRYEGVVDMHLTAGDPLVLAASAVDLGADSVTFDADAVPDVAEAIRAIREAGSQVGVAIGRASDPDAVAQEAQEADVVLCSGHEDDLPAIVRRLRMALPSTAAIQVEGPAVEDATTLAELYEAGARVFVMWDSIFSREDLPRAYRRLVQEFA